MIVGSDNCYVIYTSTSFNFTLPYPLEKKIDLSKRQFERHRPKKGSEKELVNEACSAPNHHSNYLGNPIHCSRRALASRLDSLLNFSILSSRSSPRLTNFPPSLKLVSFVSFVPTVPPSPSPSLVILASSPTLVPRRASSLFFQVVQV